MPVLQINSPDLLREHIGRPGSRVILMASATFCVPCRRVSPIFEALSDEFPDDFVALKTNLDEAPGVNDMLGVGSVPTFIYWRDGVEVHRTIGGCSREGFVDHIRRLFGRD